MPKQLQISTNSRNGLTTPNSEFEATGMGLSHQKIIIIIIIIIVITIIIIIIIIIIVITIIIIIIIIIIKISEIQNLHWLVAFQRRFRSLHLEVVK